MLGQSVTQRIGSITQPRGGYITPKSLTVTQLHSTETLEPVENIHPGLVGTVVDYLSRFASGATAEEAFDISLRGAYGAGELPLAVRLMDGITGLDDASIVNAVRLVGFDVVYRAGMARYAPVLRLSPDSDTVSNIRRMVLRAVSFFDEYGPVTADGFTFEGGYTATVRAGDGDFLTADTLWDFKVSKNPPTKDHTLQLLMYWRMGLHSIHPAFRSVRFLGIFNPRTNTVYRIAVEDIPDDIIALVEADVIGY